ncbi:MAG: ATP-binding protein [Spirochaetia bacterium]
MGHTVSRRLFALTVACAGLFLLAFPLMVHLVPGGELFGALMIVPLVLIAWNFTPRAGLIAALAGIVFTEILFNGEHFFVRHLGPSPSWTMLVLFPAMVYLFVGISFGRLGAIHRTLQNTIDSRNQLERTLVAAQQSAQQYLDIAGVILMVLDREGRISLMNRKGHEIFGYGDGELVGRIYSEVCLPRRVREEMRLGFDRLVGGEAAMEYHENPIVTRNGQERLIAWHNTLLRDSSGAFVAILSSGEDITERRKAEKELAGSHAHLEAIMNALPDILCELDRDGVLYDLRTSHRDRLLYPQVLSSIGGKVQEIFPADAAAKILDAVARAGRTGEYRSPPLDFQNGRETRWLELSVAAVSDYRLPECRFVVVARDVTERRGLQQQLIQSQKMEAVGRLSGGIAHDFNNILMVIISYCDLIQRGAGTHGDVGKWVKIIKDSAERAASLTYQLLSFSRKQLLAPKIVDVDGLVEDMRPMLAKLLGEDVRLIHESSGAACRVKGDASQLQQVIMNLTVNARDAIPDEGEVTIRVSAVEHAATDALQPAEMPPGSYVLIEVKDTGAGMDAETLSHLFEPFFTTKELGRGTGLGLSIVYGIVKQSDGYLHVESTPGIGSTFHVYLPRLEEAVEERTSRPGEECKGSETILLVEDADDIRGLIRQHLAGCGYRILEASHGAEASRLCQENPGGIQVLVTDIGLPGLKGWKVADAFRAANPGGRIIYMTGYTDEVSRREIGKDPRAVVLQKPFSMTELAARIRALLDAS